jgi:hypothetical protein
VSKAIVASKGFTKKHADRFNRLRQRLTELSQSATKYFFEMGAIMKEIRDEELWKMGHESFTAFYSDPEFDFKKSSVYHAIKLVELFPEYSKFVDIPVSKLIMIAAHVTPENKNQLVNDACESNGWLRLALNYHPFRGSILAPLVAKQGE